MHASGNRANLQTQFIHEKQSWRFNQYGESGEKGSPDPLKTDNVVKFMQNIMVRS